DEDHLQGRGIGGGPDSNALVLLRSRKFVRLWLRPMLLHKRQALWNYVAGSLQHLDADVGSIVAVAVVFQTRLDCRICGLTKLFSRRAIVETRRSCGLQSGLQFSHGLGSNAKLLSDI